MGSIYPFKKQILTLVNLSFSQWNKSQEQGSGSMAYGSNLDYYLSKYSSPLLLMVSLSTFRYTWSTTVQKHMENTRNNDKFEIAYYPD